MAKSIWDFLGDPSEDTADTEDYGNGLLHSSRGPNLGMLSLAAGLLEPVPNGKFSTALANGLKGWAGGAVAQRKLEEADAENDPNALMRKYMAQARIKAQMAKEYPEAEKWGMAPFVDENKNVYQFGSNGSIRQLTNMQGRFTPPTTVDTGGSLQVINPSNPTQPLAEIPKGLNPREVLEYRPDRYRQTQNQDGSFTQTDTNTGKQDVYTNPNAPKAPPSQYLDTMAAMDDFIPKMDAYISSLKGRGRVTSIMPGQESLDLNRQHGDLVMDLKNIFGLGVLNAGDLPQINRQIINPTDPRSALYSNDALIDQATKAKEAMLKKRDSLKNQYRDSGFRVDSPVRGPVSFNGQNGTADYSDIDAAERDLQAHPEWPKETQDQVRGLIDKARSASPYSVNKSSMPTLKKPSAADLDKARAKIAEFANDPAAQANVIEQIKKRFEDAGYDTAGLQ